MSATEQGFTGQDVCLACEHSMRSHFQSVTGEVVCLVSESGTSSSGVIGLPWTRRCDCVNYESDSAKRARDEIAERAAERDELRARIAEAISRDREAGLIPPLDAQTETEQ